MFNKLSMTLSQLSSSLFNFSNVTLVSDEYKRFQAHKYNLHTKTRCENKSSSVILKEAKLVLFQHLKPTINVSVWHLETHKRFHGFKGPKNAEKAHFPAPENAEKC